MARSDPQDRGINAIINRHEHSVYSPHDSASVLPSILLMLTVTSPLCSASLLTYYLLHASELTIDTKATESASALHLTIRVKLAALPVASHNSF